MSTTIRSGTRWVIVGQGASQLISIASLLVLYRLVDPQAFGLFGMALPFVVLPRTLAVLGLSAAAVQRHAVSEEERSVIFWMQTSVGLIAMLATLALAAPAAWLYGVPQVDTLIRSLAGTVFIASLSATHYALLERRLLLARVTTARIVGQTLGALAAIVAALGGWQATALVVQQYGELLAVLVASFVAAPWLPHWPRRSQRLWRELAMFSGYYSLSSLLFVVVQNIDKLLLGIWLGESAAGQAVVGAYTQAYQWAMRFVYLITTPLSGMLLPILSRARTDPALFARLTVTAFRVAAILLIPVGTGLWLTATDIMTIFGGARWENAGHLLAALAPLVGMQAWINLCGSTLAAQNLTQLLCAGAVFLLLLTLQAVVAGMYFGQQLPGQPLSTALALAWSLSLTTGVVVALPYTAVAVSAAGVPARRVLMTALPPLRAAAWMALTVLLVEYLLQGSAEILPRLVAKVAAGIAAYAFFARRELVWLWDRLKDPTNQGVVVRVHDGGSLAGNESSEAS